MTNQPGLIETVATLIFFAAILHTFLAPLFHRASKKRGRGPGAANALEFLGELELVFGIWSLIWLVFLAVTQGTEFATQTLESTRFTEPLFVFSVMLIAGTRPLTALAHAGVQKSARFFAQLFSLSFETTFLFSALTLGPWLGSFITEPAAMTVTALILKEHFFDRTNSTSLKYGMLGTLFVNISIGGTLTHFAAPPIVMVANTWNWDTAEVFSLFGWKALVATCFSTLLLILFHSKELKKIPNRQTAEEKKRIENASSPRLCARSLLVWCRLEFTSYFYFYSSHFTLCRLLPCHS